MVVMALLSMRQAKAAKCRPLRVSNWPARRRISVIVEAAGAARPWFGTVRDFVRGAAD